MWNTRGSNGSNNFKIEESQTSSAFSRLSRPGSGRDRRYKSGEDWSNSAFVPEHHRVIPLPGGGRIPTENMKEKREGLKISFSQPNMRPLAGLPLSSPETNHSRRFLLYQNAHSAGKLKLPPEMNEYEFKAEDLKDEGEIGRGAFGSVNRMSFRQTGTIMAVKRIRSTVDEKEQKELLMDLEVVMKCADCPNIVSFFGAIFKEGDCWICMEIMDISSDKFYKYIYEDMNSRIPENIIGKITVATVFALNYLKERLKIIHRDVKPSNILLDIKGNIKLCDFGISGRLVDSIAKTRDAGCRPYMAPERIDPQRARGYDVRSDVWSLGITLVELSTGKFPYPKWNSVFEQLQQVVHGDPPKLSPDDGVFTPQFLEFVNTCLIKEERRRPKYDKLLEFPFIKTSKAEEADVAGYVTDFFQKKNDDMDLS
ncbi:dual specificity mitogen-activated protein kinase kinase 4 [Lepeophtheirus salmonis]|uniref:dual specificity mitogen-activated protein kinase kinase 4 n=1 Tax=Lepeophtheirus salmonis TaxID=72036 RepID=UPI001AE16553|nr:dual specificity mitogen-activated protein kinase kinase 4-like [Lepeophtheirus salmonis]